ncbi:hypothetical protein M3225_01000 [Priestia aryabhattai]|uniref:hypothetical protein n=1 Tax=Priestia aryabhattai TaxID=412384 RepID=UPI00203C7FED|nr:hypothetical protein [Priestia aryabhattai]MCM3769059.1 hypothetical protein [Priestia aryabhattai]
MAIRDIYLLKETPIFELSPGEEVNVNLTLEKGTLDEKLIILILVLILNIKCEYQCIKKYYRLKIFRPENLCFPRETKKF